MRMCSSRSTRRGSRPRSLEAEGEDDAQLVADEAALLNARVDPRTAARVGGRLTLAVDPARFHFFDLETGASLLDHVPQEAPAPVPVVQQ